MPSSQPEFFQADPPTFARWLKLHFSGTNTLPLALRDYGGPGDLMSAEQYRRHASEGLKLIGEVRDHAQRTILLNMAIAWTELARQAEKNRRNDIVYETPPSRSMALQQQQQPQRKADKDKG